MNIHSIDTCQTCEGRGWVYGDDDDDPERYECPDCPPEDVDSPTCH